MNRLENVLGINYGVEITKMGLDGVSSFILVLFFLLFLSSFFSFLKGESGRYLCFRTPADFAKPNEIAPRVLSSLEICTVMPFFFLLGKVTVSFP